MSEPTRPDTLPPDARWNPDDDKWERGAFADDGATKVGPWTWWRPGGAIVARCSYDDQGRVHGLVERFHPNGERSQWATWLHGATHGVQVWCKPSEGETDERTPFPPNVPDDVVRMDMPYHRGVPQPAHFTLYLRAGLFDAVPCDAQGRSVRLGDHVHKLAADTTLMLVADGFTTLGGERVDAPDGPEHRVRWIFRRADGDGVDVRLRQGREATEYRVSAAELSDAFTLGADHYVPRIEARRPDSVPEGAYWNARGREWGLGERKGDKKVGEWTWWRPDGSMVCRSTFNRHGQLDGPFTRFHPDGTASRAGAYSLGKPSGLHTWTASRAPTTESFRAAGHGVWRAEVTHDADGDEAGTRYFLEDGTETNRHGVPVAESVDDALFLGHPPEGFLTDGFPRFLDKHYPRDAGAADAADAAIDRWQALWGRPLPADVSVVVRHVIERGDPCLYEWRAGFLPDHVPDVPEGGNVMESIIAWCQRAYLGTALDELFGGLVCIGTLGDGDSYQVSVIEEPATPLDHGQVYVFDHDEHSLNPPFARNLSAFAYLVSLCDARTDSQEVSDAGYAAAWRALDGLVAPTWHFQDEQESAGAGDQPEYESSEQLSRFLAFRARWIIYLLRNDGVVGVEDAPDQFDAEANRNVTDATFGAWLENAPKYVPTGLYLLWRCFFFDQGERLAAAVEACRGSDALLLRDAAALVEELQGGRKQLGSIDDIHALRDRFLALDLDPERAEARAAERDAAERADEARRQASVARAEAAIAADEDLLALAWAHLEDAALVGRIAEHWRGDPAQARQWAVVDWIAEGRYVRDNAVLRHELVEALEYLPTVADPRLTPLLVSTLLAGAGVSHAREMLEVLPSERAARALLPLLDRHEEYHHTQTLVATLAGAARLAEAVPRLIDNTRLPMGRIERIKNGDCVAASVKALGAIADATACAHLLSLLDADDIPLVALGPALADAGLTDALVPLAERVATAARPAALWAIAKLAEQASPEQRAAALPHVAGLENKDLETMVVAKHAERALGGDVPDLRRWVRTALAVNGSSRDAAHARKAWALRVAGAHDDLEPELITAWTHTDLHVIRRAAHRAAERRGIPVTVRPLYRWVVEEVQAEGGIDALHALLDDETALFRSNVVNALATLGDPRSAGPIARALDRFVGGWAPVSGGGGAPYPLRWMVKALVTLDQDVGYEAIGRCLLSDEEKVADPVLRAAPAHAALLSGMARWEARGTGWMQASAQEWLDAWPDPGAVAAARAAEG